MCSFLLVGLSALAQTAQPSAVRQPGQLASGAWGLDTISAPPLTSGQKFEYMIKQEYKLRGLIGNAVGAALGQWNDTPGPWGQGLTGYSYRFASGFGQTLIRETVAWGIDSGAYIDPRYFPSDEIGYKGRLLNAVKQIYLSKKDDGRTTFAYGRIVSAFVADETINAWQPSTNNSFRDGLTRTLITLGVDGAENVAQEVFQFARPKSLRHRR